MVCAIQYSVYWIITHTCDWNKHRKSVSVAAFLKIWALNPKIYIPASIFMVIQKERHRKMSMRKQIFVEVIQMQIGWQSGRYIEMVDGLHIVKMHSCDLPHSLNQPDHKFWRLLEVEGNMSGVLRPQQRTGSQCSKSSAGIYMAGTIRDPGWEVIEVDQGL